LSPETCRVDLKRSINGICCSLLVGYITVLVMHGQVQNNTSVDQTNILVSMNPKGHQHNTNISILKLTALNINSITDHFMA
jgi:hypothetical protein